jgi:hypothetical protein
LVEETPESLGHQPNWTEDIVVSLVRLVKHEPSYIPIPSEIGNVLIETVIAPNHSQAKLSHLKNLFISSMYLLRQPLRQGFLVDSNPPWSTEHFLTEAMEIAALAGVDRALPILPAGQDEWGGAATPPRSS